MAVELAYLFLSDDSHGHLDNVTLEYEDQFASTNVKTGISSFTELTSPRYFTIQLPVINDTSTHFKNQGKEHAVKADKFNESTSD